MKLGMKRLSWVVPILLWAATGCVQQRSVGGYFADRGRDFADCFRVSVGAGVGVHACGRLSVVQFGEGYAHCWKVGWDGRAGADGVLWRKLAVTVQFPILLLYDLDVRGIDSGESADTFFQVPTEDVERDDVPADVFIRVIAFLFQEDATRVYRHDLAEGTEVTDFFWTEIEATAGLPSARLGFNIVEFFDSIFGIFCLDMVGDDVSVKGGPGDEAPPPAFVY